MTVRVRGLKELVRTFRKTGRVDKVDQLKDIWFRAATAVIQVAQSLASTLIEERAAASLKASRTADRAKITLTRRKGYEIGAEFGAYRNQERSRSTGTYRGLNQFKPWTGSNEGSGHFLFPAVRKESDKIAEWAADAIEQAFQN